MAKNKLPDVEELFKDPKHSELADWFRGIFKTVMAETADQERERKEKENKGKKSSDILDFLLGMDEDDDDDEEDKD